MASAFVIMIEDHASALNIIIRAIRAKTISEKFAILNERWSTKDIIECGDIDAEDGTLEGAAEFLSANFMDEDIMVDIYRDIAKFVYDNREK